VTVTTVAVRMRAIGVDGELSKAAGAVIGVFDDVGVGLLCREVVREAQSGPHFSMLRIGLAPYPVLPGWRAGRCSWGTPACRLACGPAM
jgi:hypothetical protein